MNVFYYKVGHRQSRQTDRCTDGWPDGRLMLIFEIASSTHGLLRTCINRVVIFWCPEGTNLVGSQPIIGPLEDQSDCIFFS